MAIGDPDYRQGLAVPVQADGRGSFLVLTGEEYVRRLVMVAMDDAQSDNPFQRDLEGLGDPLIFALSNPMWKRFVENKVKTAFDLLKTDQLAELSRLTWLTEDQGDGTGTQEIEVEYINLETDELQKVQYTYTKQSV
jgi:hypothetical protein